MALKALKELLYGGRTIAEGEEFEALSPLHARTLIAVKKAKLVEASVEAPVEASAEEPAEEKPKKVAKKAVDDADDGSDDDESGKAKSRKYQTRKLTAEE
jgi:hypothetical protein